MKEIINNLFDSKEYTRRLEERRIGNTNKVKIRLNEILDSNLNEGKESFYISSVEFRTYDQFMMAEDILRENGWNVQQITNEDLLKLLDYYLVQPQ